jgi:CxxC motif-containing protein (DUF1111 family)
VKLRTLAVVLVFSAIPAFAQTDPGPRGGAAGAGGPLSSVASNSPTNILNFFNDGQARFQQLSSVKGKLSGEKGVGLGPRYNSRSCAECHAQPAVGGTSPSLNPEVGDATADGATNQVQPFVHLNGPVVEARFIFLTDAAGNPITTSPDGGVHELYTIAGRSDASTCTASAIQQPNFATQMAHNNVVLRIPSPTFGGGLIENIDESDLLAVLNTGNPYGIAGTFNRNGNDGTISRFGWKAQNKSLELFAAEAYNVEMGVSNEIFTQERPLPDEDRASGLPSQCRVNNTPEDHTNFNPVTVGVGTVSDTVAFAMFMRLLAPPAPQSGLIGAQLLSVINGSSDFDDIGCAACHHDSFTTTASDFTSSLDHAPVKLYSDLQIHHMGTGLADNVQQGNAGGDQFRTAPLWGLGQRIFLLHDGRTTDLMAAIAAHSSTNSEANTVILNFNALSASQKQDVLNFLRSL